MLPCFLILALAAWHVAAQPSSVDVIIIGAGVAAIKAATDLKKANFNVLLLEARSRPYGRIDSQKPDGWPISIELGAQWFHGDTRSNAVLQYAQTQLQPKPTIISTSRGEDQSTFDTSKASSNKMVTAADEARWAKYFTQFNTFVENRQEDARLDATLQSAINDFASRVPNTDWRGFLSEIDTYYVQEYAASPDKLSLAYFNADNAILGSDSVTTNYSNIFAAMVTGLGPAVRLDSVVTGVARSGSGFQVSFTNPKTQATGAAAAKYVLTTLPLGVLQASYDTLFPAGVDGLRASRKVAINTLGMGLMNKVVMQFPSPFWKRLIGNDQWIANVPNSNAVQWNEFYSLRRIPGGQNILVAFQAGNSAVAAESLSDADTVKSVMTVLRAMFGANAPDPVRYVITRWSQDPYARGAYSYHKAGAAGNARSTLCAAAGGLFFAGEACSREYPGAVQGAWLTGAAAASAIVQARAAAAGE